MTVCVRQVAGLQAMVRRGRQLADQSGRALRILLFQEQYVRESAEMLEYAFSCARQADAGLDAYYTGDDERMKSCMRRGTALLLVPAGDERLIRLGKSASWAALEVFGAQPGQKTVF